MKEIFLQGGPLNRCTLCRTKREKGFKREKQVFCPLLWLARIPETRVSHTSNEGQNYRMCSLVFVWNSYVLRKVSAGQAVHLCLGDLTWKALAKCILVSLLEVRYLRLRTAGPELEQGSSGSFPTAPHWVWRTVPAGQSQENLWSRMFPRRISWRALANKWQSISYKRQICSGNRSFPQIAPSSPGTPPHSGNASVPTRLHPACFPQAHSAPRASPLAPLLNPLCRSHLSSPQCFPPLVRCCSLSKSSSASSRYPWTLPEATWVTFPLPLVRGSYEQHHTLVAVYEVCEFDIYMVLSKYQLESAWVVKTNGLIPYEAFSISIINFLLRLHKWAGFLF